MSGLNRNTRQLCIAAVLLLFCAGLPAFAQYDTGAIVGSVQDQHGAVIPKASVKITNVGTDRVWTATTNDRGEYSVPGLPRGTYRVEATQSGFVTGVVSDIVLYATDMRRVDVSLKVGALAEQVTVTAQQTVVNTQTSELGATIDAKRVQDLPLNGRDFTQLLVLVPGSVVSGGFSQTSLGGFETSLAGVNFLLDGADATRIDINATSTQLGRQEARISRASVDSIQEFKVLDSTYSAEFGRSMGDVVNVITKSGTNNFHGTVFEYFRNDALDAMNYFDTLGKSPFHLNQFGGNLSGPIAKNKLFFFVNYEGVRQVVGVPSKVEVLNSTYRGMASANMLPVINAIPKGNGGPVLDPVTHVPTARDYFFGVLKNTLREDTGSIKVDWNAASKDTFSFRYNMNDNFTNSEYGPATGQLAPSYGRNQLLKGTWNHVFNANLLNEFGMAYNRPHTDDFGGGGNFPLIFQCSSFWGCNLDNNFGLAPGEGLFSQLSHQSSFQILDTMSVIRGRHSIRYGVDFRHNNSGRQLQPQVFMATDSAADFVTGVFFQESTLGYNMVNITNDNWGIFFQDDIRLKPRLTLNLGLRYEYNTPLKGGNVSNFDLTTLSVLQQDKALYSPDRNNFGPRVGFSWDVLGKGRTVVRGGFGIFYNPQLTGAALSLAQNDSPTLNVNLFDIFFFGTTCNGPVLSYPLPAKIPTCTPPKPASVNILDPHLRDSYSEHWSFGIQQQVVKDTVLELAYVGNHGLKLPAGASSAGLELNIPPFSGAAPRISPNFFNIRYLGDFLSSRYEAFQASLRRRIAQGLNVDANYTWSHEWDDAVNIFSNFQNSLDPRADWSRGDIDVRHNFTLGLVYDVPAPAWLPKRAGSGWQLSSLIQARSGLPFNITTSTPFLGLDLLRPNLVPGQSIRPAGYNAPFNQLNPAAFAVPAANQYGDLPRNAGLGPGFNQLDLAVGKTTALNERLNLQFRVETFNLFNHPNFSNPVSNMDSSQFGQSTSTVGSAVGTGTSRQVQFAAKLIF